MFTESDLRELIEYRSPEPVLSIYLNTEPSKGNADVYKLRLRNLLKEIELTEDKNVIETYFNHQFDWSGRSVAIFSCAPQDFFRAYSLALPLHDRIATSDRPSIKPLANLLENYGGYGVILADKQGARLFYFHMGKLVEQEGWIGETVKHIKRGGASTVLGRRGGTSEHIESVDEIIERNKREIVDFAVHFFEEKHIRRVLLGGTDDNIALLRSMLPKAWQSLIVGTFPMSMTASHTEVMARAMEIGLDAERKREAGLVENLVTASAKGGTAVTGLAGALDASLQGRVQTLVVSDGFHIPGYRCTSCNHIALNNTLTCQLCNGKVSPVDDVVDLAIGAVLTHKGEVEVIQTSLAFEKAGNIGAYLRY